MADTPTRIVLADDGSTITLAIYAGDTILAATIDPIRAIALAQELIAAALPKLRAAPDTGSKRP